MKDLSIIMASSNEPYLTRTIDGLLGALKGNTDIIVVVDGDREPPPSYPSSLVKIIYNKDCTGQRACINQAAWYSDSEFIVKLDPHCVIAKGFDIGLLDSCKDDNWTIVPRLYKCHPRLWKPILKNGLSFCSFNSQLISRPWRAFEYMDSGNKTMCFSGSCFFMNRKRFLSLGGLDELHGGYGQVGVEIACKTWLSGGQLIANKNIWYAHLFKSTPHQIPEQAINRSKYLWKGNNWPLAKYDLKWLVTKFWPVPGWSFEDLDKL